MARRSPNPSVGLNAATGHILEGWPHVVQSLQDIFTTRFGSRVMREWYGSFVPHLMGRTISSNEVTPFFAAVTSAIEQFEPRYRVTRIQVVEVTRAGAQLLTNLSTGQGKTQRRVDGHARTSPAASDRRARNLRTSSSATPSSGSCSATFSQRRNASPYRRPRACDRAASRRRS